MSFQDAVIFLAAIVVIVSSGVILGSALRGRGGRRQESDKSQLQERKANLYADLIGMLDSVADASDMQKQRFIYKYYEVLIYAPDEVVRAINRYLDAVTAVGAELAADEIMELRGSAIKIMRADICGRAGRRSTLHANELYRIEIQPDEPAEASEPEKVGEKAKAA